MGDDISKGQRVIAGLCHLSIIVIVLGLPLSALAWWRGGAFTRYHARQAMILQACVVLLVVIHEWFLWFAIEKVYELNERAGVKPGVRSMLDILDLINRGGLLLEVGVAMVLGLIAALHAWRGERYQYFFMREKS